MTERSHILRDPISDLYFSIYWDIREYSFSVSFPSFFDKIHFTVFPESFT